MLGVSLNFFRLIGSKVCESLTGGSLEFDIAQFSGEVLSMLTWIVANIVAEIVVVTMAGILLAGMLTPIDFQRVIGGKSIRIDRGILVDHDLIVVTAAIRSRLAYGILNEIAMIKTGLPIQVG